MRIKPRQAKLQRFQMQHFCCKYIIFKFDKKVNRGEIFSTNSLKSRIKKAV